MMLSRRRSSGQIPGRQHHSQPSHLISSSPSSSAPAPPLALRNVSVLFSVSASAPAASAGASQLPDLSLRRRLFAARDATALAIGVPRRNPAAVKLYHVAGTSVLRAWPLSAIRSIDGLGLDNRSARSFALFLGSSTAPLVWTCRSPSDRARFLWSLLQTCVKRLKRAPPAQRLKLLDLQLLADAGSGVHAPPPPDPALTGDKQRGNDDEEGDVDLDLEDGIEPVAKHHFAPQRKRLSGPLVDGIDGDDSEPLLDDDDEKDDEEEDDEEEDMGEPTNLRNFPHLHTQHHRDSTSADSFTPSRRRLTLTNTRRTAPVNAPSSSSSPFKPQKQGQPSRSFLRKSKVGKRARHATNTTATTTTTTSSLTNSSFTSSAAPPKRPQRVTKPPTAVIRNFANVQRVTRTLSEPKVSASILPPGSYDDEGDDDDEHRQPDTIMVPTRAKQKKKRKRKPVKDRDRDDRRELVHHHYQHKTAANSRHPNNIPLHRTAHRQVGADADANLNMDDRAFLAAAKIMGAKDLSPRPLSPLYKEEVIEQFANVGRDPKDRSGGDEIAVDDGDDLFHHHAHRHNMADGLENHQHNDDFMDLDIDRRKLVPPIHHSDHHAEPGVGDREPPVAAQLRKKKGHALIMSEHKMQQELKQLRLADVETKDLLDALQLFHDHSVCISDDDDDDEAGSENDSGSAASKDLPLETFGSWAEARIQQLEIENITEIVTVEKQHQLRRQREDINNSDNHYIHNSTNSNNINSNINLEKPTDKKPRNNSGRSSDNEGGGDGNVQVDPHIVLVESLREISPWLEKNETLLKPYAKLSSYINEDVKLIEQQICNVVDLEANLGTLVSCVNVKSKKEHEMLDDVESILSEVVMICDEHHPNEVNYSSVWQAVQLINRYLHRIDSRLLYTLHSMTVVENLKSKLLHDRRRIADVALRCLRKLLDVQYHQQKLVQSSVTINSDSNMSTYLGKSHLKTQQRTLQLAPQHLLLLYEDVRLKQLPPVAFKEFTKGGTCLYACSKSAYAELVEHYVSLASVWVQHASLYVLGLRNSDEEVARGQELDGQQNVCRGEGEKAGVEREESGVEFVNRLMDCLLYSCLTEGFRAHRLFSPIFDEVSNSNPTVARPIDNDGPSDCDHFNSGIKSYNTSDLHPNRHHFSDLAASGASSDISLAYIIRRIVPSVAFIDECIRKKRVAKHVSPSNIHGSPYDDGERNSESNARHSCLLLSASSVLDSLATTLQAAPPSSPSATPSPSDTLIHEVIIRVERRLALDPSKNPATAFTQAPPLHHTPFQADLATKTDDSATNHLLALSAHVEELGRQVLPAAAGRLLDLSGELYAVVDEHVRTAIALIRVPRDVGDRVGRAAFFSRVRYAAELCVLLADAPVRDAKAKTLCDRLVAGTMQSIEVVCTGAPAGAVTPIKMQGYGLVAARLAACSSSAVTQLAHLAARVRRHVTTVWFDERVAPVLLVPEDAAAAAASIKTAVTDAMETAADTIALPALYSELVTFVRGRLEHALRHSRKYKNAESRRVLLTFSRDLLSSLRAEQRLVDRKLRPIAQ